VDTDKLPVSPHLSISDPLYLRPPLLKRRFWFMYLSDGKEADLSLPKSLSSPVDTSASKDLLGVYSEWGIDQLYKLTACAQDSEEPGPTVWFQFPIGPSACLPVMGRGGHIVLDV